MENEHGTKMAGDRKSPGSKLVQEEEQDEVLQEEQEEELKKEQEEEQKEEQESHEKQLEKIEEPGQNQTADDEGGAGAEGVENAPVHVQTVPRSEKEFVGLNVGGVVYMTSRSTLVRFPNSLLGVLFTASVPTPKDDQGNYMIDGDGLMFRHILNYLRRGTLSLPKDFQEHQLLQEEAAFYQLPELQGLLSGIMAQTPSRSEPTTITMTTTETSTRHVIEVYVAEEDDKPQTWRIYGGLNFLEKIPTLSDYIHHYRKGSQCLEFTTQHPMFPSHTYRRFPKTTLFFHIFSLGFKLHTSDCMKIFNGNDVETSWLRYLFTSTT